MNLIKNLSISWYCTDNHNIKISPDDKTARKTVYFKHVTLAAIIRELLMWGWWWVQENVTMTRVRYPARDRLIVCWVHETTKSKSGRVYKKNLEKKLKERSHHGFTSWKVQPKFFKLVLCNPFQSLSSVLNHPCSLMAYHNLFDLLFFEGFVFIISSCFLQFNGNFAMTKITQKLFRWEVLNFVTLPITSRRLYRHTFFFQKNIFVRISSLKFLRII